MHSHPVPRSWLEDETLHSLYVRHHVIGGGSDYASLLELFGKKKRYLLHDFPCGTEHFAQKSGGIFGSTEQILSTHTVLPAYLPFLDVRVAQRAIEALADLDSSRKITVRLRDHGQAAFMSPLRLCDECVAREPFPHWRRTHQLPGVYRCNVHGSPLKEVVMANVERYRLMLLPTAELSQSPSCIVPITQQDPSSEASLRKLADTAQRIVALPWRSSFEKAALSRTYLCGMQRLNLLNREKWIKPIEASAELLAFAAPLNRHVNDPDWLRHMLGTGGVIQKMISPFSMPSKPLLHVLFIAWLFPEWNDFISAYHDHLNRDACKAQTDVSASQQVQETITLASRKAAFKEEMLRGSTYREVGQSHRISSQTARAWALELGLLAPDQRAIMRLSPGTRSRLTKLFKAGEPLAKIVEETGIKQSNLVRMLWQDPVLSSDRKQAIYSRRVAVALENWSFAVKRRERGDVGATRVARLDGNYLCTCAKEVYAAFMSARPPLLRSATARDKSWVSSDESFASSIDEMAQQLRQTEEDRQLTFRDIILGLEKAGFPKMKSERFLLPHASAALRRALRRPGSQKQK